MVSSWLAAALLIAVVEAIHEYFRATLRKELHFYEMFHKQKIFANIENYMYVEVTKFVMIKETPSGLVVSLDSFTCLKNACQ